MGIQKNKFTKNTQKYRHTDSQMIIGRENLRERDRARVAQTEMREIE